MTKVQRNFHNTIWLFSSISAERRSHMNTWNPAEQSKKNLTIRLKTHLSSCSFIKYHLLTVYIEAFRIMMSQSFEFSLVHDQNS